MNGLIGVGYEVKADLYDIAKRIKEIDPDYFVYYSYRRHRYEIHSKNQKGNTLALVVPYPRLDGRTLELVRKTSVERFDEIMEEERLNNERLDKLRVREITDKAAYNLEATLSKL